MDINQTALAPASDTPATDLAAEVESRRTELGIAPAKESDSAFTQIVNHLKTMPETPAEAAAREDEIAARDYMAKIDHQGRRLVSSAGERYRGCRLETFKLAGPQEQRKLKVVTALMDYTTSLKARLANREGIVLYGPVGTGKDHLAYAVAREFVLAGRTVVWLNGQDWFGEIRDAMDTDTPEGKAVHRLTSPDVAVISDPLPPIGNLTQHQATMLYRAIDDRYTAGKPTIVTVNVKDDAEADNRLGAATWDRICDGAWKIHCNWPSFRKPAREVRP